MSNNLFSCEFCSSEIPLKFMDDHKNNCFENPRNKISPLIDLDKSIPVQPNYNIPPRANNGPFEINSVAFQANKNLIQELNSNIRRSPNDPFKEVIKKSKSPDNSPEIDSNKFLPNFLAETDSKKSTRTDRQSETGSDKFQSRKVHKTVSNKKSHSNTDRSETVANSNNISPASVAEPSKDPVANDPNPTQIIDLQAMAAHVMNLQDELHKFRKFVLLVGFVLLAIIATKIAVDLSPKSTVEPMTQLDKNIERQIQLQVIAEFESLIKEKIVRTFKEKFEQTINKQIQTKHTEQLEKVNFDIIQPLEEKIYGPIQSVNMLTKYFYIYVVFSVFVASILFVIPFYLKFQREGILI